jgi:hypothetical protein
MSAMPSTAEHRRRNEGRKKGSELGVSHVVSDGNDRLVPMLDRDRA